MILNDPTIISDQWMIIGHQENTLDKGRIDLLAIAPDASLILIELKRDRTPREVVAQALDYASGWMTYPRASVADLRKFLRRQSWRRIQTTF